MTKAVYLPFRNGTWQLKMGLKALRPEAWFELDEEYIPYLARKRELWRSRHAQIFAQLPGSEAGQREILDNLLEYLTTYFSTHVRRQGNQIDNLATGEVWQISDFAHAPLDLAGRLVQEDLCLMMPGEAGYYLAAAALYFPSYWRLQDKLGLPLQAIHAPVPGYGKQLGHPVDTLLERMKPDHPGYRLNWSIVDTPELWLGDYTTHIHQNMEKITSDTAGERLWIRVERQTLRRFAQSNSILFTIRTYIYPLSILQDDPQAAAGLLSTLDHMPPEMQNYKSITALYEILKQYLEALCL